MMKRRFWASSEVIPISALFPPCEGVDRLGYPGMMKRRFWTSSEFIPISARFFPPLRRGGSR